jgi:hypothetical protein
MDARTTPFTRMVGLANAYRADRDMLEALELRSPAGERVLDRLLRTLGHEPVGSAACCTARVASEPSLSS